MKTKGVWVAVGLFIALCGSACGSFLLNGLTSSSHIVTPVKTSTLTPPPLVNRTGRGDAALGTFRLHGEITYGISCRGHGLLQIELNGMANIGTRCPEFGEGAGTGSASYGRTRFSLHAPPNVRWRITIYEAPTK